MTITAQTSKTGPYNGNGTTTVFSYTFEVQDEAHLVVTLADASGVETVQVLNTDYTVSGVGNANGGQVTMSTAPAISYTLTISRNIPITQEVDLENRRSVAPEVLEDAYDKLTQIAQDLSEQVGRAIKTGVSTTSPADLPPTDRAGRFLAFNASGDPVYASGSGGDAALRTDLAASTAGNGSALVTFNPGTGATARTAESKLRESVSVKDFGAVGDGVVDDTAAIQAALDTENVVFVPAGEYRVTDSIVINSNKSLVMLRGSQITGDMGTPKPVIRLIANFASLYGFGLPIVKADHQTGGLPSSINEGIINVGPATLGVGANINWAMIDGIRVMGNQSLYPQYVAATNTDIDKYIGIKMVHGRYLQPGAQSTSLYNSTVQNCMIQDVGCGFDMDPVVQGNNFINNYFFRISFAGYRMRGCGENSFSHGFFHGSVGTTFFRMESTPLRVDGISGSFVGGETVTGGTSGATVVLYSGFPVDETEGALYGAFTGQFEPGETVTGGTSGATATVSTTRQIYYEGSLGRRSLGNICQNIIGEPGATAFIGTQNAGPIGGRHARFYVALDGCSGNMYEGRGNTGHSVLDFDGNNALTEQGTIISPGRNASFDEISATTSVDVGTTTGSAYVNTGSTNAFQHHTDKAALSRTYTYGNVSIAVGEKERFSFLMGGNNVSALIRISVVNDWGGSSTDNRHRAAEYICRVFTNSSGNSVIQGPTAIFEFGFAFATDFIFTSGSGDRTFTIDIANPNTDAGSVVQTVYHIDVLSITCTLQSATVV